MSQPIADLPAIAELDVDPPLAAPDGVCAVDLRPTVDREALATGAGA